MIQWKGVYPALTTKFTADEAIDIPAFNKNLQAQIDAGIDGAIIGGSLGEASTLLADEKIELLKAALDVSKGSIPILMNIAERSTKAAVTAAQQAQEAAAKAVEALAMNHDINDEALTKALIAASQSEVIQVQRACDLALRHLTKSVE